MISDLITGTIKLYVGVKISTILTPERLKQWGLLIKKEKKTEIRQGRDWEKLKSEGMMITHHVVLMTSSMGIRRFTAPEPLHGCEKSPTL
jgi:hypothetical protein